ncbi:MAG: tetratricopeptide repeat-containing sulfotransferase family protein [Rhodanobacteraceae bacterium]
MTELRDRQWQRAKRYIAMNQAKPARAVLESLLTRNPGDTAAHLLLSALYSVEGHLRAATAQALAAAQNPPDKPGLLGDLISALLRVGEIVEARRLLKLMSSAASDPVHVQMLAAGPLQLIGEHAAALALLERAREHGAGGREFHFQCAVELAFNGDMETARAELERCIALDPPLGRAFVQLARMHKQTADSNHLDLIDAALTRVDPSSEDGAALLFARHKELEDLKRYEEAWQPLARGNALMHERLPHDSAQEAAVFDRLIEACVSPAFQTDSQHSDDGPQPIFVLGMPRSGTTVLERMLGGHSQVESAGELGDFPRALAWAVDHQAKGLVDETTVARLDRVEWFEVGQRYRAQTQWRANGKEFFVDKLPLNWKLAGLVHRALPRAKMLHLVRDPMDVCFSNWRAYFGPGPEYAYAYDLDTLAAHYRQYRRVMAHWHHLMPGAILDVDYAQLVREPETTARSVMAFCGLVYEPGCVDLTRNVAPSATLSMTQVRQPIHARAFDEWRKYAEELKGLCSALAILPQ